jgi:DnaJ-class molecular chaperone
MRAALLTLCLCVTTQDEAYKILQDPARRAKEFDRQTALKAFKEQSKQSASAWVAARFLEKSDRQWKIAYDRLKTASGTLIGSADGGNFVATTGAKVAVSSGTLEKDVRDPAGVELDAYLKTYWSGAALSDADHRKALEALEQSIAKAGPSEGAEALKLFLLAHTSALGDRASDIISKFGFAKEGDRWGRKDELAVLALANGIAKRATVSGDVESKARSSSAVAPRYAMALFDLARVFNANQGFENVYKSLLGMGGPTSPQRTADHFKALADSFKAAVYCKVCKDGKMTCEQCQGKKRVDLTCPVCHGLTWAQKGGAAGSTLIKCTRCLGQGIFKNAGCPGCQQTGIINCPVCVGKPWRDGFKGCKDCTICTTCKGRKQTEKDCGTCNGKGRVAPFTAGIPTATCDACKGFAIIKANCAACKESGLAPCKNCGDGVRDGKFRTKPEDVYTPQPCASCGGKGFPLPNLAVPCERCMGLSFVVLPSADPLKTLIE